MTRLVAAEFRKLLTTRLWLWILLVSVAWTIGYTSPAIALNGHPGKLTRHCPAPPGSTRCSRSGRAARAP
jgi:hypothetical protein